MDSTSSSRFTSLRVACWQNEYNFVERLIKNGTDVNITNEYGETCLMLACHEGKIKMVRLLLKMGADIHRKFRNGNTMVYDCAENGHLSILRTLIDKGAIVHCASSDGITPLMIAAINRHQTIVEYFIDGTELFTREQRIDALEVLGAGLINKHFAFPSAEKCWFRAFKERNQEPIVPKKIDLIRKKVYGNFLEVATEDELLKIQLDLDNLKVQSLMILERILNRSSEHVHFAILNQARNYCVDSQFDRSFDLLVHCVELQVQNHKIGEYTELIFRSFRSLLMSIYDTIVSRCRSNPREVLFLIRKCIEWIQLSYNVNENKADVFSVLDTAIMNTLYLAFCFHNAVTTDTKQLKIVRNFDEEITKLTTMNIRLEDNRTILHLLLEQPDFECGRLSIDKMVDILLKCGMNPNDEDNHGNRALHYAVKYKCCLKTEDLLLQFGAHHDAANRDGNTYRSLVKARKRKQFITANKFITLQCFAVIAIKKFHIPFESRIPSHLEAFINFH